MRRVAWLCVTIMVLCSASSASAQTWREKIFIAAATADVVTTAHDIGVGGYEMNPVYAPIQHQPVSVSLVLSAEYGAAYWLAHRLESRHPRIAHVLQMAVASGAIACSVNNVVRWRPETLPVFIPSR